MSPKRMRRFPLNRELILIFIINTIMSLGMNLTNSLQPLYIQSLGATVLEVSFVISITGLAGTIMRLPSGFISDKIGEKRVLLFSFLILALDIIVFMNSKSLPTIYLSIFILGWFINFIRSPSFTLIPKLYGIDIVGRISGIHNTFASIGALTIPLFLGYIRDITFSYNVGWITLSGLLILGTIIILFLKISYRSKDE